MKILKECLAMKAAVLVSFSYILITSYDFYMIVYHHVLVLVDVSLFSMLLAEYEQEQHFSRLCMLCCCMISTS